MGKKGKGRDRTQTNRKNPKIRQLSTEDIQHKLKKETGDSLYARHLRAALQSRDVA